MENADWSRFKRLIYIKAPVTDLYAKWATQDGLESWFLKKAEYYKDGTLLPSSKLATAGNTYSWQWHNWDGKQEGRLIEANGLDRLQFDFDNSDVIVTLTKDRNMTCVCLEQFNIPIDDANKYSTFHGCSNGWTFWLANLKAVMEHGISLNDTQPDLFGKHNSFDVVNI